MDGVLGLKDVSSKDTGSGSKLKTGNLKRSYNMPKACVQKKMKQGMSAKAAHAACYPKKKDGKKVTFKDKYKQESAIRRAGSLAKTAPVSNKKKRPSSKLSPKLKKY